MNWAPIISALERDSQSEILPGAPVKYTASEDPELEVTTLTARLSDEEVSLQVDWRILNNIREAGVDSMVNFVRAADDKLRRRLVKAISQ